MWPQPAETLAILHWKKFADAALTECNSAGNL
jgi:hypothetical protein